MAGYTVPGVYIEEISGLSLSIVSGATAIPIFAFDDNSHKSGVFGKDETHEINSWLDVMAAITKKRGGANGQENGETIQSTFSEDLLYQSLKIYFENGGGRCYLAEVSKLEQVAPGLDDITLLVQAGSDLTEFKSMAGNLCKAGNPYFALYDGPKEEIKSPQEATTQATEYAPSSYAAVYYPWLGTELKVDGQAQAKKIDVPPSAAVAGAYCTVDRERGVWKAPANIVLKGNVRPKHKVSDVVNGALNIPISGNSINVIREFRGTGPLIWGARTLNSKEDTWRYVPVRRLFNAAEKDIRSAISIALFEPNNQPTWERVRSAIEIYLHGLWQQGALLGATPEKAYFVQIGEGVTMTYTDIKNGKMIVKVGMAAVRPAEFIILQLTQDVVPA